LLLVRHAKSSWNFPELDDIDRPLNERGKKDAPFMADLVKSKGLTLSHIISSPAKRAFKTAKQFYKAYESEGATIEKDHDLYFGSESDWLHIINSLQEDVTLPAFFSHNPTITYFTNSFSDKLIENVPTCGVIHLRSEVDKWSALHYDNTKVIGLYFPKAIRHGKVY